MPKIVMAGINIKVHPHEDRNVYFNLLKTSFKLKLEIHSRADEYLLLQSLKPLNREEPLEGIIGKIARFSYINPNLPWYNSATNDAADEEDLSELIIPANLRPNYSQFFFVFFPKKHKFIYEQYNGETSLSPNIVKSYFETLFNHPQIVSEFGDIDVSLISDGEKLEEIFSLFRLNKLEFDIQRPNPDDLEEAEQQVLERMATQNIREQRVEMFVTKGQSIKPSKETKILAKIASENGEVRAEGYNEAGKKEEFSTSRHPKREPGFYDAHDQIAHQNTVIAIAKKFLRIPLQ